MRFLCTFLLCYAITGFGFCEEQGTPAPTEIDNIEAGRQSAENADWLEFYYQNPSPEQFVDRMRKWAADGTLQNHEAQPALIGFISQLMRQNPDQIVPWARQMNDFDPKDLVVYNTALVFSRTKEADDLIRLALGDQFEEFERPSKILELPLNEPPALNMLWGFFYATGSKTAIRRIIEGFRYEDAPVAPEGVEVPEGFKPYYMELPNLARSSLYANMQQHDKVLAYCEEIHANEKSLMPMEKRNLYDLLSFVKPEEYPRREVETGSDDEADSSDSE